MCIFGLLPLLSEICGFSENYSDKNTHVYAPNIPLPLVRKSVKLQPKRHPKYSRSIEDDDGMRLCLLWNRERWAQPILTLLVMWSTVGNEIRESIVLKLQSRLRRSVLFDGAGFYIKKTWFSPTQHRFYPRFHLPILIAIDLGTSLKY